MITKEMIAKEKIRNMWYYDCDETLLYLALNFETNPKVLEVLAEMDNKEILKRVSLNRNTPEKTLMELASRKKNKSLQKRIAENPSASRETLEFIQKESGCKRTRFKAWFTLGTKEALAG